MTPWATSDVRVSPLEHHIGWAVDVLESLREPIAALPPGSADIFIGWEPPHGQASLELGHALLARLGALPVDLIFDLYPGQTDEALA